MVRPTKYFNQPQVKLSNERATAEGLRLVKEKYCDELKFAKNVGDLVDELAMQHYIIVPALSAVNPKIDPLEALLASAVAKQATLKAQIEAFEYKHRKEFEDVKPGNCKRQRVEAFNTDLMDLCDSHKISNPESLLSSLLQHLKQDQQKLELLMDISSQETEKRRSVPAKPWDDPELILDHCIVKMKALISNESWTVLRNELGLEDKLTPSYLLSSCKKGAVKYTMETTQMKEFTFEGKDSTPENPIFIHGTSVGLREAMTVALKIWKVECQKKHIYMPKNLRWKLTLDGRPLGGHEQVCVGMVPLIPGFKFQSADSVFPLMLFNGRENKHNLLEALKGLAEEMKEVKINGLEFEGKLYTVSYILCCDMSSLWKMFLDKKFGKDFCVFCHVSKEGRWDLDNPDFQILRTDLTCIFPVDLTEVVFCGLHARIRIVDKLVAQLAQTAYDHNKQKGVRALVDAVRLSGVKSFNIDKKSLEPTSLIGGNCKKILLNYKTIVAAVEEDGSEELTNSLLIWESVAQIDLAMRANAEDAKEYLDPVSKYFNIIEKHCSNLAQAYQARYSSTSPDPDNEGCYVSGLEAVDVNFYLHYVVAHMPTLLKRFVPTGLSIGDLSQEGFENAHKYHRLLYAKASLRDGGKARPGQLTSMSTILSHQYTLLLRRAKCLDFSMVQRFLD